MALACIQRRCRIAMIAAIAAMAATSAAIAATAAPTVDELVAKNIAARGGAAALRSMQTLRISGTLLVNDGQFALGYVHLVARPGRVRDESSVQGLTQVEAWDGAQGWQIDPFQGRKDPERLAADDAKGMAETAADFDGALFDWQAKGHQLAYLGTEDIDGTQAHKLRLTRRNGDVTYVWLDPEHFLEIRQLSQRSEKGVKVETETDLGDYEPVAGVLLPMAIESGRKGSVFKQKFIVRRAEVNVAADPALFAFPAPAAKAAP